MTLLPMMPHIVLIIQAKSERCTTLLIHPFSTHVRQIEAFKNPGCCVRTQNLVLFVTPIKCFSGLFQLCAKLLQPVPEESLRLSVSYCWQIIRHSWHIKLLTCCKPLRPEETRQYCTNACVLQCTLTLIKMAHELVSAACCRMFPWVLRGVLYGNWFLKICHSFMTTASSRLNEEARAQTSNTKKAREVFGEIKRQLFFLKDAMMLNMLAYLSKAWCAWCPVINESCNEQMLWLRSQHVHYSV